MASSEEITPVRPIIWAAVFVAIALIALCLWAISYLHPIVYDWPIKPSEDRCIVSRNGRIYFMHPSVGSPLPPGWTADLSIPGMFSFNSHSRESMSMSFSDPYGMHQGMLGFGTVDARGMLKAASGWTCIAQLDSTAVPYWPFIAVLGIVPGILVYRRRRMRQRWLQGKCSVCGYDLRASPDRCPECGTQTTGKPAVTS